MPHAAPRPSLKILLAAPRGFCAGVDRAIKIVELALEKFGSPVYVRHEIVHNRYVVDSLRAKGAVFVDELDEIPDTDQPVIFSAHGVAKSVPAAAKSRNMFVLDATCPLVFKVHFEAVRHHEAGREVLLIGHDGHPEVVGTMGQLPAGAVHLVETVEDVAAFVPRDAGKLAFTTQTTLSVDDTAAIVEALKDRFADIVGPHKQDICYATTNRQAAVKDIAPRCDLVLVVGAPNSSNSLRLVEVAERGGCPSGHLVRRAADIPWHLVPPDNGTVGITAGASAPEVLVDEILEALGKRYATDIEHVTTAEENVAFNIPRALRSDAAPA
ncbi:MAG: 4-hydroxy-3-methylbut-2-enyl diphosphate reductase [Alphaproteobacteria bacterium BRH_c36]|nr:MAG: 4-hydroxy-3-methylbut-2-enyl diphosphate reductase [Alphaproteobacteria bacterium BRH_c36]